MLAVPSVPRSPSSAGEGRGPVLPLTLRLVVGLTALQALALAVLAGFLVVGLGVAEFDDLTRVLVTIALVLAAACGLAATARALLGRRRGARAPALLADAVMLPVAGGLITGGRPSWGVPVLLLASAGLGLLLSPSTTAALRDPEDDAASRDGR